MVLRDVESVLATAKNLKCDLFVIGGEQVYRSFLPYIENWIVTEVPLAVEDADTFVPEGYLEGFKFTESKQLEDDLKVSVYEREQDDLRNHPK